MTQSQALEILKTGVNVFLTGEPGSGKTHTINEYSTYLRNHDIEPAITASTGIAATHIGGMTIHSWCGIGIKTKLNKQDLNKIASTQYIVKRVCKNKVLIIEEVSMLTNETLSMVDAVCRKIKQSSEPFGGMQVIFCGDFFQLPPVVKKESVINTQTSLIEKPLARFAFDSPAWTGINPIICYLTEQHRQDDENFLNILSAIRSNSFNNDHLNHIETRKIKYLNVPNNITKLFSHNADVDRINSNVLAKLPGKLHKFNMSSYGLDALVAVIKRGCLSPEKLFLKHGAVVMFTKNNLKKGFVNGTLGIIEGFNKVDNYPIVKMRNGKQIKVEPMEWTLEENGKIRGQISQLPLRLAWAITVHKSQGINLDEAVMDLSDIFEFGQGYVALSRVRRLSGLHILGWNKRAFQVHPEILVKDETFRLSSSGAETMFSKISPADLRNKQNLFIVACGGKSKSTNKKVSYLYEKKTEKINTYNKTLILWNQKKTILQIAKTRALKVTTIINHIEKLVNAREIKHADLSRLLTPSFARSLSKINIAFNELGTDKLSPVFSKLRGVYSYDKLRLARILFDKNGYNIYSKK